MMNVNAIYKNVSDLTALVKQDIIIQSSIQRLGDDIYFLAKNSDGLKHLVIISENFEFKDLFEPKEYEKIGEHYLFKMELTNKNSIALRGRFNWLNPVKRTGYQYSFGLGDRLGIASKAHLKLFKDKGVLPVLAQQSIRELNLTGRTYSDVMSCAVWSVFEEGYVDGFGADGDHLKTPFEIDYAIQSGFKTLTLDCSEHIHNEVMNYGDVQLNEEYNKLDKSQRNYFEDKYLNKTFKLVGNVSVHFDRDSLIKSILLFNDAVDFATEIYYTFIEKNDIDFEVSIDETVVPTTPVNHFFIANEFKDKGVILETMAPKFHGEFQKAIDYVGDLKIFKTQYKVHQAIADNFEYRLSIHSGSDKFAVYPTIGEVSSKGWHVKTAGTNWLEALKVIAKNDKIFMMELYDFALNNLHIAKRYYDISADINNSIAMSEVNLENVNELLENAMTRQVLHVTFGLILNHKENGKYVYKEQIYKILEAHYDDYTLFLNEHIGKHLRLLNK